MKQVIRDTFEDIASIAKICGGVLVVGLAMGSFRYLSAGALDIFY